MMYQSWHTIQSTMSYQNIHFQPLNQPFKQLIGCSTYNCSSIIYHNCFYLFKITLLIPFLEITAAVVICLLRKHIRSISGNFVVIGPLTPAGSSASHMHTEATDTLFNNIFNMSYIYNNLS